MVVSTANYRMLVLNLLSSTSLQAGELPDQTFFNSLPFGSSNSVNEYLFECSSFYFRCGPCQMIAPVFERLSNTFPNVVFLKVDVDKCPESAASHSVSAMPTFIFFRNKGKVARIQGADAAALEAKLTELSRQDGEDASAETGIPGMIELSSMIQKSQSECLNESDEHTLSHALDSAKGSYLESDCDEQLIISLAFSQNVKLHSLKLDAPEDKGPKILKLFINLPYTLDFDKADSMEPTQTLELTNEDLAKKVIPLRYVKYQNVSNLQIFVKNNQTDAETTVINHLSLIGTPLSTVNMKDLKPVNTKKPAMK